MLITEIRPLLSQTFDIVYHEFDALCRGNLPASRLLAYLFGLTEVLENNPKYAVREGWIYKSGRNLWEDLGLTRRGYEKARDYLVDLGLVAYKRAGVHGIMNWRLMKQTLLAKVYALKGKDAPDFESGLQQDAQGFHLPKWVPLKEWTAFVAMRLKMGKRLLPQSKKKLLEQLETLRNRGIDVRQVMEKSVAAGWAGFYVSERNPPAQAPAASAADTRRELEKQMAERNQPPPPKSDPDSEGRQALLDNLKKLK